MKYMKFAPWGVCAVAFLLVASLFLSFAMTVVDFYDGLEDGGPSDENPDVALPDTDTPGDGNGEEAENEENKYVTNLANAFGLSFVQGLVSDLDSLDKELYSKLMKDFVGLDEVTDKTFLTSQSYDPEKSLLARSGIEIIGDFAVGKETVKIATKQISSSDASVKIVYEDKEVDIKTVELYMGRVIINSAEGVSSLYDGEGKLLVEDMGDKSPANKRTASGEAVFADASGAYYILNEETSEFVSVPENNVVASLEYDYPAFSYKNGEGEQVYAYYDKAKKVYRYYNAVTEKQEITTAYSNAYSFAPSGYAFVKTTGGAFVIIDAAGKTVHQARSSNFFYYPTFGVNQGVYVRRYYALPYTNDISAIGSGTVDEHGWMRIRVRLIGRSSAVYNKTLADYETLVNVSGEFFDIPSGYTLEGYSDGVLLLSKDGRYGYYSIDKKWIAQPIYTYASPFVQGLAVVGAEDGTRGMIDTEGNIVLPFVFSHISNASSGLVSAYSESVGWEIFKLFGEA